MDNFRYDDVFNLFKELDDKSDFYRSLISEHLSEVTKNSKRAVELVFKNIFKILPQTVEQIGKKNMCISCGACISVCPNDAIKITFNQISGCFSPEIDNNKCVRCGLCFRACPSVEVDFKEMGIDINANQEENLSGLGRCENFFVGYSRDARRREQASSGGVNREILRYLLKNKIVDGVLIINKYAEEIFSSDIVEDIDELDKNINNSVYICVNYAEGVKKINDFQGRLAIVGLPCQLSGVKKLIAQKPALKEKIKFFIGLMCAASFNLNTLKSLKSQKGVNKIKSLSFRYGGWPGSLKINDLKFSRRKDGGRKNYLDYATLYKTDFFKLERCLFCQDHLSLSADIVLGDAWLKEYESDNQGRNLIITRNSSSNDLLMKMQNEKLVELEIISQEKIIQAQKKEKVAAIAEKKNYKMSAEKIPFFSDFHHERILVTKKDKIKFLYLSIIRKYLLRHYWFLRFNAWVKFYFLPFIKK